LHDWCNTGTLMPPSSAGIIQIRFKGQQRARCACLSAEWLPWQR